VTSPLRRFGGSRRAQRREQTYVWALRNLSFTLEHGEVLGLIGGNGAGKSTTLKILSRITEPTEGYAEVYGRIGSLLEVGTGFHPELTGRENVFLNGAILGMSRSEIRRKFDEIVEFSEVGRFVDTPVKRYSDGMYMRLAFAVAAHMEPEILIVDEVLAVGDAAFQRKCLDKMGDVAREGRTVLFVSHNLIAVEALCQRVIWLDKGRVTMDGPAPQVISRYLQTSFSERTERRWDPPDVAPGADHARLHGVRVRPVDGVPPDPITVNTPFFIEVDYRVYTTGHWVSVDVILVNEQEITICEVGPDHGAERRNPTPEAGLYRATCHVPGGLLNDRLHRVVVNLVDERGLIHQEGDAVVFEVREEAHAREGWFGEWAGVIRPKWHWTTARLEGPPNHR